MLEKNAIIFFIYIKKFLDKKIRLTLFSHVLFTSPSLPSPFNVGEKNVGEKEYIVYLTNIEWGGGTGKVYLVCSCLISPPPFKVRSFSLRFPVLISRHPLLDAIKKNFGQKNKIDFIFVMSYLQAPPSPPHSMLARRMLERRSILYI